MHIAVLKKEVIQYLDPKPGQNFIDCTFGGGGHTAAILGESAPDGRVLAFDWDNESLKHFCQADAKSYGSRLTVANENFTELARVAAEKNFFPVAGIVFDLGLSSWHFDESRKGFSFKKSEPLDMRYSDKNPLSAKDIINTWNAESLEKILREYGEERFARQIARKIAEARSARSINTTDELAQIVERAMPARFRRGKIHAATRTFQALRIAVNAELENLKTALPRAFEALAPGGRIVVISFHSLEDRIVKNTFREMAKEGKAKILTKKPITPVGEEIKLNPRSRSAKLRAVEKNPAPESQTA